MSHVRTFSPGRNLSPKAIVGAISLIAAVAVTAGVAAHAGTGAEQDHAAQAAKKILHAADAYAVGSAQAGCPTISELVEAKSLGEADRVEDAWGNRFRIVCDDSGPRVVSVGPDGHLGTADDVRFSR